MYTKLKNASDFCKLIIFGAKNDENDNTMFKIIQKYSSETNQFKCTEEIIMNML